jgi:alanine racemase
MCYIGKSIKNNYLSWAEIDLRALRYNFRQIKKRLPRGVKILAAVKANAYGHGLVEVARVLEKCGADYLGVAFPQEGMDLRRAGIKVPVLIFGQGLASQAKEIVKYNLTASISHPDMARAISKAASSSHKTARIHLKVDTGMGRLGVKEAEIISLAKAAFRLPGLKIEGIFTHFPSADEEEKSFTQNQIRRFQKIITHLQEEGCDIPIRSAANSAAIINFPESFFNMVRPGLMLYGLYPSAAVRGQIGLRPVLSLKTRITLVKDVPAGTPVSYGRTYVTKSATRIGILPIGYADGYSRHLSNKGEVLVQGRRFNVIGRICMDHTIIDCQDTRIKIGDQVTLIGRSGKEIITAEEVAEKMGTISYEVVSRLGPRVPRIFIG